MHVKVVETKESMVELLYIQDIVYIQDVTRGVCTEHKYILDAIHNKK
jgi:hypothetical protein